MLVVGKPGALQEQDVTGGLFKVYNFQSVKNIILTEAQNELIK